MSYIASYDCAVAYIELANALTA